MRHNEKGVDLFQNIFYSRAYKSILSLETLGESTLSVMKWVECGEWSWQSVWRMRSWAEKYKKGREKRKEHRLASQWDIYINFDHSIQKWIYIWNKLPRKILSTQTKNVQPNRPNDRFFHFSFRVFLYTVKSRVGNRATIQFWTLLSKGLTNLRYLDWPQYWKVRKV